MSRRRHTPEQIITALREAEVGLANGKTGGPSEPRTRDQRADVLPVAEGVWGDEGGPGARSSRARNYMRAERLVAARHTASTLA